MSWPMVRLGDVCESNISRLRSADISLIDYIDISSVDRQKKAVISTSRYSTKKAPGRAQQLVRAGDLLISTVRPNLNAIAVVPHYEECEQLVASTGFSVVRANAIVDIRWLYYYCQTSSFIDPLVAVSEKAAYPSVTDIVVKNSSVPLPPLDEQKRIVEKLEKELKRVEEMKAKFEQMEAAAEQYFKSALSEAFENVEGERVKLGEVASINGSLVTDYHRYAKYPHIGIDCIEKGTGKITGYRTVEEDHVKSGKYYFSPKHIIYSKIRPYLNKVALPDFEGLCSADSYPILPSERCDRTWLAYNLRTDNFLGYAIPLSSRAGMPKLNREQVLAYSFVIPALEKQRNIGRHLDLAKAKSEKLSAIARRGFEACTKMRKALLAEAFA